METHSNDRSAQFRLFDIKLSKNLEARARLYAEKNGEIDDRIQTSIDLRNPDGPANSDLTMYLTHDQMRRLGEFLLNAADTLQLVLDAQRRAA